MKRNILLGITFIGAVALSSCSVNKTASNSQSNDDVYFSRAKAAEEPEYITRNSQYNQDGGDDQYSDEDDYFYYDDYASRINRFSYYSPFGYYDNFYSPYGYGNGWNVGLGFGYGGYGYGGWGGGFGLGWGGGFGYGGYGWGSPWGYGYSPFGYGGFYSPYSFWGGGYGYGGYWGGYSAYNNPRPYRGNGSPGSNTSAFGNRGRTSYGNNSNGIGYLPGRQSRNGAAGIRQTTNGTYNDRNSTRQQRQPQNYQPSVERSAPSSFGGGGGGGRSSGGGGGGGRPVRN